MLAPKGTREERDRVKDAGEAWVEPFERRELPEIAPDADWPELLERALLANGDLEADYHAWKAAVQTIDVASAYPNTNLAVGFEQMFSGGSAKAWDRTTVRLGFSPMLDLSLVPKVRRAGEIALDGARAAAERFAARKFAVQRSLLQAYFDFALCAERWRIQRERVALLGAATVSAEGEQRAGGSQKASLDLRIELELAKNELAMRESELQRLRAGLNAILARAADAPLDAPAELPPARLAELDDSQWIARVAEGNPAVLELVQLAQGRRDAVELERLRYLPDFNPVFSFTGSVQQMLGVMISVPENYAMLRASVAAAREQLAGAEAAERQARFDSSSGALVTLLAMRDREREVELLGGQVLPLAERRVGEARLLYTTGPASRIDWINAQRAVLDVRWMLAEARMAREGDLAALEEFAGADVEAMHELEGASHE